MTAPTAPADVEDDLLLQIRPLLEMSKPELQKVWREVDCSDFEPVAKFDVLAAILCRLLRGASDSDSAQSQPSSSTSPVASPTNTPTPAKSFKEAVASPARSSDCTKFEKRLAEAELSLKEHKERLRELDRKAEVLDRENRQLNLVVWILQMTLVWKPSFHSWASVCQMTPSMKALYGSNHGWAYSAQIRRGHVRYVCTSSQ